MIESQNALDNATPSFAREVSNYQASISKPVGTPAGSVDPRFAKELEAYNAAQSRQPAARDDQQAAPSSSREADLAAINATMAHVNPQTGKPFSQDSRVRAVLERGLEAVFSGLTLDRAALAAEIAAFTGIPVPKAQEPTASIEPQGTPEQRLTAEQEQAVSNIMPFIGEDGSISGRHLTPALTSGFVLPDNVAFYAEETIAMCAQARKAGFTQADVDRYIQANS